MSNAFIIRDTAANFTFLNPTLLANQWGVETDLVNNVNQAAGKTKLGDGMTEWNDLDYWNPSGSNVIQGTIDCAANPNYPAGVQGDTYIVSVAGKIGGGSGTSVNAGDLIVCLADNAGGTQAAVGTSWDVVHTSSGTGDVVGPGSATDAVPALFDGTTGKLLKNSVPQGSGVPVLATSPTLTTPVLGVATATSINKVAITAPATSATLVIADGKTLTASNSITFAGTDSTTMTFPGASASIGYLNIPVNSQSVDYPLVLTDAGKMMLQTGTSKTFTIPANGSVAYPLGTALTFVTTAASGCSIAITSDTMTLANSTTTGTRTLAQNGVATAVKLTSTTWLISGTGLT